MRRAALLAVPALVLVLAGCGGGETVRPVAETVVGTYTATSPAQTTPELPKGDAAAGEAIFTSAGCNGCHTLKAANASGKVGPNLDELKPELAAIEQQVLNGGGGMPPYKDNLSKQQIADVAQYVYESTHAGSSG